MFNDLYIMYSYMKPALVSIEHSDPASLFALLGVINLKLGIFICTRPVPDRKAVSQIIRISVL